MLRRSRWARVLEGLVYDIEGVVVACTASEVE